MSEKSFKNLFTFCLLCFCDDQNSVENVYDIEDDQATFAIILDYINSIHSTADLMFRFQTNSRNLHKPAAFSLVTSRCHQQARSFLPPHCSHVPRYLSTVREAQQLLVVGLRLLHTVGEIYVGRQPGRERSVVAINVVKSIGESNQQLPTVSYIPKRKKKAGYCAMLSRFQSSHVFGDLTETEQTAPPTTFMKTHQIIWINFRTALIASSTCTSYESLDAKPTRVAAAEAPDFADGIMRYTKSSPHIFIKAIENTSTKCLGSCERKGDGSRPINKHGHKDPGSLRNPGLAKSHLYAKHEEK
ncbi:DNA primase large subunit PriL [Trichinella pseudospiralis]